MSRNQPPVAWSIAWSRGLFLRTRNTMKHFQKMRISLQHEGEGQEVEELFKEEEKLGWMLEITDAEAKDTYGTVCLSQLWRWVVASSTAVVAWRLVSAPTRVNT